MTSASKSKKRKYEDENRTFNNEWEEKFFFADSLNGKCVCLICNGIIANYKMGNLRRHHETNHSQFCKQYPPDTKLRTEKLKSLKSGLKKQQTILTSFNNQANTAVEASFAISWNIARAKYPYTAGDFVKKNMEDVIRILEPNNTSLLKLVTQIPISRHTTERRISEISRSVQTNLKNDIANCVSFSLALDESTDISDIPQLAVFIRFVTSDFTIKEELLDLVALKDMTRGIDIKNALDTILENFDVPLNNLVSIATDGAPAMQGKNIGLIGLLKSDSRFPQFLPVHCIIHREHLIAKYFNFEEVMKTVLHIVNFIRTSAKNHRQFKNFLEDFEEEELPGDINFHCIVRWLSTYNVLSRFVDLYDPISKFLEEKGKSYPQLTKTAWLQDLMFLTDTMQHLNRLNLALQGKEKMIPDLSQTILSFQSELQLFKNDVKNKTFEHFPRLKTKGENIQVKKLDEYQEKLEDLLKDFNTRFEDLRSFSPTLQFFLNPFGIDVINNGFLISDIITTEKASAQLELLQLKEDLALKTHYNSNSIQEFWKLVPDLKYPSLKKAVHRINSIFGTTYTCESMFSTMKLIKTKHRSRLTNEHLTELLVTSLTNYKPNFKELSKPKR